MKLETTPVTQSREATIKTPRMFQRTGFSCTLTLSYAIVIMGMSLSNARTTTMTAVKGYKLKPRIEGDRKTKTRVVSTIRQTA